MISLSAEYLGLLAMYLENLVHSMAKDFFLVGSTMVSMVTIIAITIPGEASETPEVTEVRKTVGVARGWEVGHGEIDHFGSMILLCHLYQ